MKKMGTKTTRKIYTADEVANYFIYLASQQVVGDSNEKEGITNLKLQKILYFAQAYFLAKLGRPLFKDQIEAWAYGPVVPLIYHKYKHKGSDPIIDGEDSVKISDEDKKALAMIWESFGGYSAGRLVDITHAHDPWKLSFKARSKIISNQSLKDYYKPLLNK